MNLDSLELNTRGIFRFYGLYLLALSGFLLLAYLFSINFINLGTAAPKIYPLLIAAYLAFAIIVIALSARPGFHNTQIRVLVFLIDAILLCGFIYSSDGLEQGLALALLISVVFANMVLPYLLGLLVAALASVSIILLAVVLNRQGITLNPMAIGAFGASYFAITILLQGLSKKLFLTIDYAAEQSRHLAKYQRLSDMIVDRMSTGIVVQKGPTLWAPHNQAAKRLLTLALPGQNIDQSPPKALAKKYQLWRDAGQISWTATTLAPEGIELDIHI